MLPHINITLPSFSVFAFIGGFFALLLVYSRREKFGVKPFDLLKLVILCAIGAFLGAKALFILTRIPWLVTNFSAGNLIFLIMRSGIVYYGGLFGALLAVKIFAKFCRYDETATYRMVVPAIPLFHGFGRIGCFLAGCCFGSALDAPFVFYALRLRRIPVQAFEAVFCFVVFILLIIIEKKRHEWDLLKIYLLSYAVFRFCIEFFRGDNLRGIFLLSTSQWISLAIVVYYAIRWFRNRRRAESMEGENP